MPISTRPKLPSLRTPTTASFPSDALLSASSIRTPASAASFKGGALQSACSLYSAGLPSAGLPSAPLEYPPTPSMLSATTTTRPESDLRAEKTPITPPLAYMDFLKKTIHDQHPTSSPTMASPPLTAPLASHGKKAPLKRASTGGSTRSTQSTETVKTEEEEEDGAVEDDLLLDSAPTTASSSMSAATDCSCAHHHDGHAAAPPPPALLPPPPPKSSSFSPRKKSAALATTKHHQPASPAGPYPLSAPATGPATFPSLRVPPSPVVDNSSSSNLNSPAVRSPWSARSSSHGGANKSPFDWDAALRARRYAEVERPAPTSAGPLVLQQQHSSRCEKKGGSGSGSSTSATSVRHIREVVTRTVTYTPRMEPAPRGKRRKLNDDAAGAAAAAATTAAVE